MSSPFIQEVRTKESILSSLSRNDPIQPLDFTLRSRYETISISFAKGPSGTEDFFDISRGFGILYGPLYLTPLALFLPPPALFLSFFLLLFHASPDAYRSNRVAVELVRLLLDNTDIRVQNESPKECQYPDRIIIVLVSHPLCFRYDFVGFSQNFIGFYNEELTDITLCARFISEQNFP